MLSFFVGNIRCQAQPSEFLRSFLRRPDMLASNFSILEPTLKKKYSDVATISVYVNNWSKYNLVYTAHAVTSGVLETSFPPRNLGQKHRDFAMRTMGSNSQRKETGGMVGWTLEDSDSRMKVSRLSLAWDIKADQETKLAVALGDFVPQYDQMWETRKTGRLITEMEDRLERMVVLADSRVTVAAKLERAKHKKPQHYKMIVTIIPQRIDVWGWVKYFKEGTELDRKRTVGPLPKITEATTSSSSSVTPFTTSTSTERSSSTTMEELSFAGDMPVVPSLTQKADRAVSNENEAGPPIKTDEEQQSRPLYQKKTLLTASPAMQSYFKKNQTIRDVLRTEARNQSVAVGIHLENWSRFRLGAVKLELQNGKLLQTLHPGQIDPGIQEIAIIANEGSMSGTSGVIRWTLGSTTDKVLSVMWSVPYNRQLWRTWLAVGLSSRDKVPSYDYMYSGQDESRFIRHQAGREFEFSDGEFIVIARMDGGSSYKPILHLGLVPLSQGNLAESIKRNLGMAVVKKDDLRVVKEPQQSEIVQSTSGSERNSASLLFSLAFSFLLFRLCLT